MPTTNNLIPIYATKNTLHSDFITDIPTSHRTPITPTIVNPFVSRKRNLNVPSICRADSRVPNTKWYSKCVCFFAFQSPFSVEDEDYQAVVRKAPSENTLRGQNVRYLLQKLREECRVGEEEAPPPLDYNH